MTKQNRKQKQKEGKTAGGEFVWRRGNERVEDEYDPSVLYTRVKQSKNKLKIKRQEKSVIVRRWSFTS